MEVVECYTWFTDLQGKHGHSRVQFALHWPWVCVVLSHSNHTTHPNHCNGLIPKSSTNVKFSVCKNGGVRPGRLGVRPGRLGVRPGRPNHINDINVYKVIDGFQMSIKRPTSGGQVRAQEAAVQQIFHLEKSSFFYL